MIIQCQNCLKKFLVKEKDIPADGRMVQCGYCSQKWFQTPILSKKIEKVKTESINDLVNEMKASDGKTYKFLGSQWAVLLSSGKTGILASKKISKELNDLTGRKQKPAIKKKSKKIKQIDPSSERLPDIYKPRKGLGFFGYIILTIIVVLSFIGILETFKNDLLVNFPETEFIFEFLNEQYIYFFETVENMYILIKDLIDPY
tara:strand:+ start:272 stop:877 length:606 start_codon:yes stop_codon:yes gene_type:complete